MSFSSVPKESKKQINNAGHVLVDAFASEKDQLAATQLVDQWRACHAYPINTFQSTLRTKLTKLSGDPLVAQRLKRMSTIVDKLNRHPTMQLSTMQDIGGVRAVLATVADVYTLASEYRDKSRFAHELKDEDDYIQSPKSPDGYRSLHLIYRYKNKGAPDYDGLLLELQIRTKLQHVWATAVETMGTFLGQALKSRQGDQDWIDFFAVVSSAFAYIEGMPRVPRFAHMTHDETLRAVADIETRIKALDKMRGFSVAVNEIVKGRKSFGKSWHYHLIILNSLAKTLQIKPYTRNEFGKAVADYAVVEARAAQGEKIEPVLVSAGPLEKLRQAYPNFFLDITDFSNKVREITSIATPVI